LMSLAVRKSIKTPSRMMKIKKPSHMTKIKNKIIFNRKATARVMKMII
jgi:hypothetical protein